MLRHGLEAGRVGEDGEKLAEAIEARLRTGRPLAAEAWIAKQERALGRPLRGRPIRSARRSSRGPRNPYSVSGIRDVELISADGSPE